jgi:malate dehydrogenase (oxaloacetate-decarboxylating)(NADP+)
VGQVLSSCRTRRCKDHYHAQRRRQRSPDVNSANIAYKLIKQTASGKTLGPILMGMSKPVHLLGRGAEVDKVVNAAAIAAVDAQEVVKDSRA